MERSLKQSRKNEARHFSRLARLDAFANIFVLGLIVFCIGSVRAEAAISVSKGGDVYGYDRTQIHARGENILFRFGLLGYKGGQVKDYTVWRMIAPLGSRSAQHMVGYMNEHAISVEQDFPSAIAWYLEAAENGVPAAQHKIGVIYMQLGQTEKAYRLWRSAAGAGYAPSQYNLGLVYLYGHGADKELVLAKQWLSRAANNGSVEAQFYLGVMYLSGQGVVQDPGRGRALLEQSVANGLMFDGIDAAGLLTDKRLPMYSR